MISPPRSHLESDRRARHRPAARGFWACALVLAASLAALGAEESGLDVKVKGPTDDPARGVKQFLVDSAAQRGENVVEVLLPDSFGKTPGKRYRVLYILPVETGVGDRYGDGMKEVRSRNIHNKHDLICVHPTFDTLPWYADHAEDSRRRHASYLRHVVVPLIEKHYPTLGSREGRLLLGYSKSGWGAFSLIFTAPDFYGAAAAWDSPLAYSQYDSWPRGWTNPFGNETTFRANCPILLLDEAAKHFKDSPPRLVLLGSANFKKDTAAMHKRMKTLGVAHVFDDSLTVKHDWHSGWVVPAVDHLTKLDKDSVKGDR